MLHFLNLVVAIASSANQSSKAFSGWVFAPVEKVFQWNNLAWSDATSADSDGMGAIEQPLGMTVKRPQSYQKLIQYRSFWKHVWLLMP